MGRRNDYIPTRYGDFFVWQGNLVKQVTANALAWLIASGKVSALQAARSVYEPLYNAIKVKQTRNTRQVDAHELGLKSYKKTLRTFVRENLVGNTAISHDEKKALGINPGRKRGSSRPAIATAPNVTLKAIGGLEMLIECRMEKDSGRPHMHPHADVIEFRMKVSSVDPTGRTAGGVAPPASDLPPAKWKEAPEVSWSTKARFIKMLKDPNLSGKWLYVFARYHNQSDESKSSPWSEMAHVRIS